MGPSVTAGLVSLSVIGELVSLSPIGELVDLSVIGGLGDPFANGAHVAPSVLGVPEVLCGLSGAER